MTSIFVFVALVACLCATAFAYVKNAFSYWKRRGIPYIKPSFPFGNCDEIFLQKTAVAESMKKLYESTVAPVLGYYSSIFPALLVRDPKILQNILVKDFHNFQCRKSYADEHVDPMAGNLLLQNGEKWKTARKEFSPAFTSAKLKEMVGSIIGATESLNEFIGQYADQPETIEVRELFTRCTTNCIASVGFGIDIDCIKNPDSEFRVYGKRVFEGSLLNAWRNLCIFVAPTLSKIFRPRFICKDVGDFMINIVSKNVKYREENNIVRKDFFQLLMQLRNTGKIDEKDNWSIKSSGGHKSLSIEEMSAQAFLFFAAGYETSASTMSFCLYELCKDPDAQQKAYEEIVSVLDKYNGEFTYDSINEMKYVDNCIQESLRMHPTFGVFGRMCQNDYRVPDTDIVIEKGTHIMVSVNGIHYDPRYYEEPYTFNPERFAEQKSFLEMPFLTFGLGPRNCIGRRLGKFQSKAIVVKVLQQFHFELGDQHQNNELKIDPTAFARLPSNGINLRVFKR